MMLSAHLFPFGLPALLYREPWIRSDLSDIGLTCYTSVFYNFVRLRQVYYSFTYKVVSAVYAAFGTPQYSSPRFNIAYAILMFLFASATTAILLLRLSATDCSQRLRQSVFPALNLSTAGGAVDYQRSLVTVAPFAYMTQPLFSAAGMLSRNQPNKG